MDQKYTLADFFKTLSEEKAEPLNKDLPEAVTEKKVEFSDFFKVVAEGKTKSDFSKSEFDGVPILTEPEIQPEFLSQNSEIDLSNINEEIFKEDLTEKYLGPWAGDTSVKVPDDPLTPLDQKFVTHDILQKHYKTYIERVQKQLSSLGGGGEVNLRYLNDVARETIDDGLFLKYNGTSRKFEFANVNANALITNTTHVTTSEYTVQDDDYYLGVDYAGPTTIILPASDTNGRCIVIKDEDGDAEINPITVQGTVDNDAGGFILQINNGSIQLIYRNGWRII